MLLLLHDGIDFEFSRHGAKEKPTTEHIVVAKLVGQLSALPKYHRLVLAYCE